MGEAGFLRSSETTMRWFGPVRPLHHGQATRVATPLNEKCQNCLSRFVEGDQGFGLMHLGRSPAYGLQFYHRRCLMDSLGIRDEEGVG